MGRALLEGRGGIGGAIDVGRGKWRDILHIAIDYIAHLIPGIDKDGVDKTVRVAVLLVWLAGWKGTRVPTRGLSPHHRPPLREEVSRAERRMAGRFKGIDKEMKLSYTTQIDIS